MPWRDGPRSKFRSDRDPIELRLAFGSAPGWSCRPLAALILSVRRTRRRTSVMRGWRSAPPQTPPSSRAGAWVQPDLLGLHPLIRSYSPHSRQCLVVCGRLGAPVVSLVVLPPFLASSTALVNVLGGFDEHLHELVEVVIEVVGRMCWIEQLGVREPVGQDRPRTRRDGLDDRYSEELVNGG